MKRSSVATGLVVLSAVGLAGLGLGAIGSGAARGVEVDSLGELAGRLAECETWGPCTRLVYVRSPAMPLSERGGPRMGASRGSRAPAPRQAGAAVRTGAPPAAKGERGNRRKGASRQGKAGKRDGQGGTKRTVDHTSHSTGAGSAGITERSSP